MKCEYTVIAVVLFFDRWESLSGDDSICECCDSQCVISKKRRALMKGRLVLTSLNYPFTLRFDRSVYIHAFLSINMNLFLFKGSATSQLLMVSDQPSMKEKEDSAIISTSSSMTSNGGSATAHYHYDLQSRDNHGWTTVDLYDKEDENGRYIKGITDLEKQGYMGELLVENDKSTVTKAVLLKDAESGYLFDSVISKGEMEEFEDGNDDVSQPEQVQKLNWKNNEKSLTEINQLREQIDSKEVKGKQRT